MFAALIGLAVVATSCSRQPSAGQQRIWAAELGRLQAEQDSLRSRLADLIAKDEQIARIPDGEVTIAVPTAFVRTVIGRLFEDVAKRITLQLRGIKAHTAKTVKKVVTIGEFVVDVDVDRVVGKIESKKPTITFGGDRVTLALPVAITEGTGEATIRFVWDGKNVAGMACGDLDVTKKVTGKVVPASYVVSGSLKLEKRGRRVVATPVFPETRLRIRVKASQAAWDTVNAILDEQRGVCGFVLDKVDVPGILKRVTEEKGFNIRVPVDKLKPMIVPAGVSDSVTVAGRTLAIWAETHTVRIDPDAIWYSANVRLERAGIPAPAPPPSGPDPSP
jgi:hypothetical protein